MHPSPRTHQAAEALAEARRIFETGPTWAGFFRQVFSSGGLLEIAFPEDQAIRAFRLAPQYREIVQMLHVLRDGSDLPPRTAKQSMITVRLPGDVHAALRQQAAAHEQSLNRFCVDKLLDAVTAPPAEAAP